MTKSKEYQHIRLEKAMIDGRVPEPQYSAISMMLAEYNKYESLEDSVMQTNYWTMIKAIVKSMPEIERYIKGQIPFSIKQRIYRIADATREEVYQSYLNIQTRVGFLPIRVDVEELNSTHHIAHEAAMRVFRSIERRLKIAYKCGGWDGSFNSAPNHFGQRSLDAPDFMEVFE